MADLIPRRFLMHIKEIKVAPILMDVSEICWSAMVVDSNGVGIGAGTADTKDDAIRIAIAESMERLELQSGLTREERIIVKCAEFPTRCGFAAGFERAATRMRSLAEAVERWIWSQWIDHQCEVAQVEIKASQISPLAAHYAQSFDEVRYFERVFEVAISGLPNEIRFGAVVCLRDGGAFPGSRVCSLVETPWTHALIEAYRHLKIYQNIAGREDIYRYMRDRIVFFGRNGNAALNQIALANSKSWPSPEIDFSIELRRGTELDAGYFLFRSLCQDFVPWHQGGVSRFII